jgi:hypothetical protein
VRRSIQSDSDHQSNDRDDNRERIGDRRDEGEEHSKAEQARDMGGLLPPGPGTGYDQQ